MVAAGAAPAKPLGPARAVVRARPALRRERWETPDGDFLDLDWLAATRTAARAPCVVVLHGLEGSSESHYALGLMGLVEAAGWRGVVMHFRSCSGELNRLGRLYHSGETSDLDWVLRRLIDAAPGARLGLVGVSLGGNVALKWLGEHGEAVPEEIAAAVAISVPFDLDACATALDRGMNRVLYTAHFLRTMKAKIRAEDGALRASGSICRRALRRGNVPGSTIGSVTAPIFGFADEEDYWSRSSSGPYLSEIRRPTLLINARERPLRPAGDPAAGRGGALALARGGLSRRGRACGISRGRRRALLGRAARGGVPRASSRGGPP